MQGLQGGEWFLRLGPRNGKSGPETTCFSLVLQTAEIPGVASCSGSLLLEFPLRPFLTYSSLPFRHFIKVGVRCREPPTPHPAFSEALQLLLGHLLKKGAASLRSVVL